MIHLFFLIHLLMMINSKALANARNLKSTHLSVHSITKIQITWCKNSSKRPEITEGPWTTIRP